MIPVQRSADPAPWLENLHTDFLRCVDEAVEARGVAHVALSGGSTPQPFYARLGQPDPRLDRVQWWIGDERCVPPTHEQSNERMIRKCFGARFAAGGNVLHSWHTSANWEECAIAYGRKMKAALGRPAVFDLILLGLGTDGHTASLFPGTKALEETHHNAVCNEVPQLQTMRLTMTYPVLNAGRAIWFLISGADKAPMVKRLERPDPSIPAGCLQNSNQTIYWQA